MPVETIHSGFSDISSKTEFDERSVFFVKKVALMIIVIGLQIKYKNYKN